MATVYEFNSPPVKGSAWTFYISLISQDDPNVFKTSPTLASGDITVSKDGGSFANIASLPSQIGTSGVLKVDLSTSEMNANVVVVKFSDVSGAEWQDALAVIYTTVSVTPDVAVASIAANAITASAVASNAVDEIVDAVWDELLSGHTTAGSTGKALSDAGAAGDPWEAPVRTLTQTVAEIVAAVEGQSINIYRGDTFSATLTGLAANTNYVSIDFMVKRSPEDADSDAILWIRKNESDTNDGLMRLNGADLQAPVVAGDGSITVNSATSLTISLAARASDDLIPADGLYYEIQYIFLNNVNTATSGICNIKADIVRAIE